MEAAAGGCEVVAEGRAERRAAVDEAAGERSSPAAPPPRAKPAAAAAGLPCLHQVALCRAVPVQREHSVVGAHQVQHDDGSAAATRVMTHVHHVLHTQTLSH